MVTYRQPFRGEWPITQFYGERITSAFHTGLDYGCPAGTHVLASADGTVMAAGWDATGYGFRVILKHGDGRATLYAHLESISVSLHEKVLQGEEIGVSGSTGNSTGPHLHFEARNNWADYHSHFDPMTLPMRSVDDTIGQDPEKPAHPVIPAGICRIVCDAAYQRYWKTLQRKPLDEMLYRGDLVYIFDDVKYLGGIPFRFTGGNTCIAEYDGDGTQILEAYGNQKEN